MGRRTSFWFVLLLIGVSATYSNSFHNEFHFDDFHTVVDNPAIRSLKNIPHFFTDAATFSVLPANRTYRPIVSTSLAIDYALGHGYTPLCFHATTFALFLLLVVCLFGLYRLIFNAARLSPMNQWLALFSAAWFGFHPAMAETVNYIIQRGDLYCTFGCVSSLYLYVRWPRARQTYAYLPPLVFALFSKPPAAVFPLLLLLYLFFFGPEKTANKRTRIRRIFIAILPSVALVTLLLRLQSAMTPPSFRPSVLLPWQYRLTQPYVWLRYFGQLFLPIHLNVDTDLAPISDFNLQAIAGLTFLALLVAAIWYTSRSRLLYPISFGLIWFILTQLPTSIYPLSEVENDHRMFFSFAGLIPATVWAFWLGVTSYLSHQNRARWQPLLATLAFLILCSYAYGAHVRNAVWHDEESLWRDDVLKSPHNGRGLMIYGLTQMNKGFYDVALSYFERALQFTPSYATLEINLGVAHAAIEDRKSQTQANRSPEAERHFLRAIALQPNDDAPRAYYGRWLGTHGRSTEALYQLNLAVAINPDRVFQHQLLVEEYGRIGDLATARSAAQKLLAVAPNDPVAQRVLSHPVDQNSAYWINLSLAQYRQGLYDQSMESARRALALDAHSAEAWNNLAANNGALHRWDDAIGAAQVAISLKPDFQLAKNNLAWSLSQKRHPTQ